MRILGTVSTELVFSHPQGQKRGAAIVPPECFAHIEAERARYDVHHEWHHETDPVTPEKKRPAFKWIEWGRLAKIKDAGIRHGERFVAIFEVRQVKRKGTERRQFWLVAVKRITTGHG
jgi:hypothetical protein